MSAARNIYFRRRRSLLSSRHLCIRCGSARPEPGKKVCRMCALEKRVKKTVTRTAAQKAEKIGRLLGNRALLLEGVAAIDAKITQLQS